MSGSSVLWGRSRSLSEQAEAEASVTARREGSESPSGTTDLLLRFFDSDFFDEWIAVSYLYKHRQGGVHDYLCNRIYALPDASLERYLHQLCSLAAAWPTASLDRTLVDACVRRSPRVALKAVWYLQAAAAGVPKNQAEALRALRTECEEAALRAHGEYREPPARALLGDSARSSPTAPRTPKGGSPRATSGSSGVGFSAEKPPRPPATPRSNLGPGAAVGGSGAVAGNGSGGGGGGGGGAALDAPPADASPRPGPGSSTYELTRQMVDDLCETSSSLRSLSNEDRQAALRQKLAAISEGIEAAAAGVWFPLEGGKASVVRIPAEEAVILNSREKAPFLVCIEVVEGPVTPPPSPKAGELGLPEGGLAGEGRPSSPPTSGGMPSTAAELERELSPRNSKDWGTTASPPASVTAAIDTALALSSGGEPLVQLSLRVDGQERVRVGLMPAAAAQGMRDRVASHHRRVPSDIAMAQVAMEVKRQNDWAKPRDARDVNSLSPEAKKGRGGRGGGGGGGSGGEPWSERAARVQAASPYGHLPGWSLKAVIVKSGDDCRQELLAVQVCATFQAIFQEAGLPLWLRPYEILVTSTHGSLIEAVTDAPSIHSAKSRAPRGASLRDQFVSRYGANTAAYRAAQRNFVESMAGYSIMTFVLQLKDRHNGNILLDAEGHIIHIDFSFMLSNSPGGINFESAPFKLTRELLEVMDSDAEGTPSDAFNYYKVLTIQGFLAARKHAERLVQLVEMMSHTGCPCFRSGAKAVENMRRCFRLSLTEEQCVEYVLTLISDSLDAWSSRQYDFYQRVLNGIL